MEARTKEAIASASTTSRSASERPIPVTEPPECVAPPESIRNCRSTRIERVERTWGWTRLDPFPSEMVSCEEPVTRWTISLECSREDGTTSVVEVATIERGGGLTAGDVGLQLAETKRINACLQALVMSEQLRKHCAEVRRCPACEHCRPLKDTRRRRIDTVLGPVVVRAPRFRRCGCVGAKVLLCPVSDLLPGHTTPELRHLQVTLGANLPYRRAAALLRQFLPDATCFNHATMRNRVVAVGRALDAELRAEMTTPGPASSVDVWWSASTVVM